MGEGQPLEEKTSAAYGFSQHAIARALAERCQVSAFFATTARAGRLPGEENRTRHAPSERAVLDFEAIVDLVLFDAVHHTNSRST